MKTFKSFSPLTIVALLLLAGCGSSNSGGTSVPIGKTLTTYTSCEDLTAALANAPVVEQSTDTEEGPMAEAPEAASEGEEQALEETEAATDVEEADIVKADDRYVYVLHQSGKLVIYDALDSASLKKVGEVDLNVSPSEMVVEGDVAAVIGSPSDYSYASIVSIINISDRTEPAVAREVRLDGTYVDSRLVGHYMHIVTSQTTDFESTSHPISDDITQKILDSTYAGGAREDMEVATLCTNIYMPAPMRFDAYYGYYWVYTTQIATIDLADLNAEVASTVALAAWPTVAASPHRLMLADWDWEYDTTALHLFDIESDPSKPVYTGATTFTGKVLNQFSMDESEGLIRVAMTTNTNTFSSDDNDNGVIVFQETSGAITETGRVTGIAQGESIWSARFMNNRVFLVTYETIDPLISVDLTDATNPAVMGQLEVPGVSTYLHAIDDTHLLSVGLDFENSTTWGGNVALSLFVVSDLSQPTLAHRVVIEAGAGNTYSEANSTHKAFAYFPDAKIVAIPVTISSSYWEDYASKLYVYRVDPSEGFTQLAAIDHSDIIPEEDVPEWGLYGCRMRRALMVGNLFFSISDCAVETYDQADFATPLFSDYLGLSPSEFIMSVAE